MQDHPTSSTSPVFSTIPASFGSLGDPQTAQELERVSQQLHLQAEQLFRQATKQLYQKDLERASATRQAAERLLRLESVVLQLAQAHQRGEVLPSLLGGLRVRAQFELLLDADVATLEQARSRQLLQKAHIPFSQVPYARKQLVVLLPAVDEPGRLERDIAWAERLVRGGVQLDRSKPQPALLDTLCERVTLETGQKLLLVAGDLGGMAEALSRRFPTAQITVLEERKELRALLLLKSQRSHFQLAPEDSLQAHPQRDYRAIILSHPAGIRIDDIPRLYAAYDHLAPGGVLEGVVRDDVFQAPLRKEESQFQIWMWNQGAARRKLESGWSYDRWGRSLYLVSVMKPDSGAQGFNSGPASLRYDPEKPKDTSTSHREMTTEPEEG